MIWQGVLDRNNLKRKECIMGCDCGCGGNPNCWCQRQQEPAREERFRIIIEAAKKEGILPAEESAIPSSPIKNDKEKNPQK